MSALSTKRPRRQRQSGASTTDDAASTSTAATAAPSETSLPASKRLKSSHVPSSSAPAVIGNKKQGLGFLVDDEQRSGKKLDAKLTNGVPDKRTSRVDESRAIVASDTKGQEVDAAATNGKDVISLSSGEEDSSEYQSSEDEADEQQLKAELKAESNGHASNEQPSESLAATTGAEEDVDMVDGDNEEADADADADAEPSFGDMLASRNPDPIDVAAAFPNPNADSRAVVPSSANRNALALAPTGTSLSTVLTQALKTNDKDMLETCFQLTDIPSVRSTIQRLHSPLVGTLLTRLAERIHRRPGRTGHLMVWVQWSLVAHGGYLATQPDVLRKLKALNLVLRERAQGLQPLLQLKGKLDMLSAQLELRRGTQAIARETNAGEIEEEEGVLYIDGQDDEDWSEDEEEEGGAQRLTAPGSASKTRRARLEPNGTLSEDEEDDDDDDMPDGIIQEGDDEEDDDDESADAEDEEDAEAGMFDLEAEESDGDDDEKDDSADEFDSALSAAEEDEDEGDESDEPVAVKQPKPQTLNRKR